MSDACVLALDLGTSGCKGAIYTVEGRLRAEASQDYPVQRPHPHWVEQIPDDWWQAAILVCRQMLQEVPAEAIAGIGLSGQVPTMVLVDAQGHALAPAMTWQDRRADEEAAWLQAHIGEEQLQDWLGMALPTDAGWPPARLLWWRRHQPEMLARAARVFMAKDYLLAQLTGVMCSDAWSAKGLTHLLTGEAVPAYYAALDIPVDLAPSIGTPWSIAGTVHKQAAEHTGLRVGTPVVAGWSDALCGMVGTGGFGTNVSAFNLTGTSEIIGCVEQTPRPGLLYIPAAVTGGVSVVYGPTQSGGDSLVWFTEWSRAEGVEMVLEAAEAAMEHRGDLLFLPYLQGERAPLWDSEARGAFVGLRREHGPGDGARAVLEGVAMSVRHVLETCRNQAHLSGVLRVSGGSTRADIWNQMRADVTGMTVEVTEHLNAAPLGAAMLAAVGLGWYHDLAEAAVMVRPRRFYAPRTEHVAQYEDLYQQYRALYQHLSPIFSKLARVQPVTN